MRVKVNRDACVGAGNCVRAAPAVFSQDDDEGLVELRTDQPAAEDREKVRAAERLCPAMAITVEEEEA